VKGLWNVPPRNFCFTGREDILDALSLTLQDGAMFSRPPALSGLSGIGKTQTAVEFAHRHRAEYDAVFWIGAETRNTIISGLLAIARLLDLPQKDSVNEEQTILAVQQWLGTNQKWLIILDNADDLLMVRSFLPPAWKGHIIFTTCSAITGKVAQLITLEKLTPDQGAYLLLKRSGRDVARDTADWADALLISQEVDGLPLALEQAGAYIEGNFLSPSEYFNLYKAEGVRLLEEHNFLGEQDHAPVTVTFSLAFKDLARQHSAAIDFLRVCSFLPSDDIPEELFTNGVSELKGELALIADNAKSWTEFIGLMCRRSLLKRNFKNRSLSLHRVVQAVLREEMNEEEKRVSSSQALSVVDASYPHVEYDNPLCERLLPHALHCLGYAAELGVRKDVARLTNQVGYYLHKRGDYSDAEALLTVSVVAHEHMFPPNHIKNVSTKVNLVNLYSDIGKIKEAEELVIKLLGIVDSDSQSLQVVSVLNSFGCVCIAQKKFEEAQSLYEKALNMLESLSETETSLAGYIVNNLAHLLVIQGKPDAEKMTKRALDIRERVLPPDHPDISMSLNNLAVIYKHQGRFDEAEPLFIRALAIRDKAFGQEHPETGVVMHNLAMLYLKERRKLDQAASLIKRVIKIQQKNSLSGRTLRNGNFLVLAEIYSLQGKLRESLNAYKKSLIYKY